MSAADLAVVLVTIATLAAFVALVVLLTTVVRLVHEVRLTLDGVRRDTLPLIAEMSATVERAGIEVERVDELIDAAASIQHTVDSASRLTYLAFARPLIKAVAFWRGIQRGTRRAFGRGARRRRRLDARRADRELGRVA